MSFSVGRETKSFSDGDVYYYRRNENWCVWYWRRTESSNTTEKDRGLADQLTDLKQAGSENLHPLPISGVGIFVMQEEEEQLISSFAVF